MWSSRQYLPQQNKYLPKKKYLPQQMCNRERFHRALSSHSQPLWKEVDIFEETTTELSRSFIWAPVSRFGDLQNRISFYLPALQCLGWSSSASLSCRCFPSQSDLPCINYNYHQPSSFKAINHPIIKVVIITLDSRQGNRLNPCGVWFAWTSLSAGTLCGPPWKKDMI